MHAFIVALFIKELLIQALGECIKRLVRVLQTSNQKLSFFYSCFLNRRVYLYINYWEIGLKSLVVSLSPHYYANEIIIIIAPFIIWSYLNCSHFTIFRTYDLDFDGLVDTLIYDLKGRLSVSSFWIG
jgi:hypothetical protein